MAGACVDRARIDRVLQHLPEPAKAVAELRRVSKPGALVAVGEPDWATLAIDAGGAALYTDFAEADSLLGLTRKTVQGIAGGHLDRGRAVDWLASLRQGPFLASFMFFNVVAEAA